MHWLDGYPPNCAKHEGGLAALGPTHRRGENHYAGVYSR
jgi:hypothetical protein